jgi:hypothetical protein
MRMPWRSNVKTEVHHENQDCVGERTTIVEGVLAVKTIKARRYFIFCHLE